MRIELEQIEQIEKYLLNMMSDEEKGLFEAQVENDSNLKKDIEAQQGVMAGIQRMGLMMSTKSAYSSWRRRIWLRRIGISFLIIVAIFSTAFFWPGNNEEGGDCPCYEYEQVHDENTESAISNTECCIIPLENKETMPGEPIEDTACFDEGHTDSLHSYDFVDEELNVEFDANGNILTNQVSNDNNNDNNLYENEQIMASYPGGSEAMYAFLQENIIYPQIAADNNESGTVYVEFVVNSDGSISNAKVTQGVSNSIDKEAVRVVNLMPKWNPATIGGVPTVMSYTAPIQFLLAE